MDKQRYLDTSIAEIDALVNDNLLRNQLYQVRSRAILSDFGEGTTTPRFTFDPDQIWRTCDFIFSETMLLLSEGVGDRTVLISRLKPIAESFEFLAKFSKPEDVELLLINAALCYHLAGYQANALCLGKQIEERLLTVSISGDDPEQFFALLYRQSLVDFLKRDINSLRFRTSRALTRIRELQQSVTAAVADGSGNIADLMDITAHGLFHQGLSQFVQFCIAGKQIDITHFEEIIRKSSNYFTKAGDVRFGTITSELLPLIRIFSERSTWQVIRAAFSEGSTSTIWEAYLRNLATKKSIVEFWPAQLVAIQNGLLTNDDSYIVQMPTSAGKTFVAELAILSSLTAKNESQCLYIAPYRALVNEIETKLSDSLGAVGYRVSSLIGGFEFDVFQEFMLTNSDVLVATPEKTELLLRTNPEFFTNLDLVVIDEGHMIDEGVEEKQFQEKSFAELLREQGVLGRGTLLEVLVSRIKTNYPNVRFVFLSAVMPEINTRDFVNWLSRTGKEPLKIDSVLRPSRQVLARFRWIQSSDLTREANGQLEYTSIEPLTGNIHPFVPYFIRRKQYLTGDLTPTKKPQKRSWPSSLDNKTQTTALLAAKFARSGPVLVFCAQRSDTYDVINNLITTLKYLEASDESPHPLLRFQETPDFEAYFQSQEWLGENHPLTNSLKYGVGLHIGPLPDPVRRAIERDYAAGIIRILVSTNTLGQGVNLPIKTAIIYSLERAWVQKDADDNIIRYTDPVKRRDFWNICGRAGRAGMETEGQVVFVQLSANDAQIFNRYRNAEDIEEVDSALYRLLVALIERRISSEELIGYLDSHILALLAEEVVDTGDESVIERFLSTSLVGVQAIRKQTDLAPLTSTVRIVSSWIRSRIPDKEKIRAYATTGLKVASCENLEWSVDQFLSEFGTHQIAQSRNVEILQCNDILIRHVFDACARLEEMQPENGMSLPEKPFELFQSWLQGASISEIRTNYWASEIEDFSRYISDQLTYKYPWGINGFLRILAYKLNIRFSDLPQSWQYLSAMAKFGVDDVISCWAGSIGVSSRRFASALAEAYLAMNGIIDFSTFIRWIMNLPVGVVFNNIEGNKYEKQQFLEVRKQISVGKDLHQHIISRDRKIIADVHGIQFEGRQSVARLVSEGDAIELELEPENQYDSYAIKVLLNKSHLGYVERNKARIISFEMDAGSTLKVTAINVEHPSSDSKEQVSIISLLVEVSM